MKRVRTLLVGAVCLIFASCGQMYMLKGTAKPEIKPSQTAAKLIIIRTTSFGFAVKIDNFVDGKFIGQTQGKSYFITEVEPGTRYVIGASENNACARLNFEAGKVYYLMQAIFPGIMFARTGFGTMTPEEADKEIKEAKYFILDPAKKASDMDAETYKKTCADFEKEAKEDPDRHKDVLTYKGY
jgi:hypothetical protein